VLEIIKAIKVMRSDAAPRELGVIGKCLKHCSRETVEAAHEVIRARWNDEQENLQRRMASLTVACKGRATPNISTTTKELHSKITPLLHFVEMVAGPIALCGTQARFGLQAGVGCQDAIFTIRSSLQLHRHHNLLTWTLHVNLVKAFDTANHQLLCRLLKKFGVPDHLTGVIK
jgi:hypothetical protein